MAARRNFSMEFSAAEFSSTAVRCARWSIDSLQLTRRLECPIRVALNLTTVVRTPAPSSHPDQLNRGSTHSNFKFGNRCACLSPMIGASAVVHRISNDRHRHATGSLARHRPRARSLVLPQRAASNLVICPHPGGSPVLLWSFNQRDRRISDTSTKSSDST
jgi:hypothetical protein